MASSSSSSAIQLAASSDLFEAPRGAYLIHACNCRGVWGSGIALQFKRRFPTSFDQYSSYCVPEGDAQSGKSGNAGVLGKALICEAEGKKEHRVVCVFTSLDYGKNQSSTDVILEKTASALRDFIRQLPEDDDVHLAMCSINSGKFGVPWNRTASIIEEVVKSSERNLTFHLYTSEADEDKAGGEGKKGEGKSEDRKKVGVQQKSKPKESAAEKERKKKRAELMF